MEQFNLPLLGSDYEKLEFELEVIEDRIKGLDSYIYVGKRFNNVLNYPTDKTEFIFSFDILEVIIISFKKEHSDFYELTRMLGIQLISNPKIIEYRHVKSCKFITDNNEVFVLQNNSNLYLIISNPKYSDEVILSILW